MIENTTDSMRTDAGRIGFLAASMGSGGSSQAIEEQERAGQAQLLNSTKLPTKLHSPREEFEAVGFVLGPPDPRDPMFQTATLPTGWTREGSDHAMWSYILDEHGRRRASIFYKAAFYDRDAFMSLVSVGGYLWQCVQDGTDPLIDDTWATPSALAEAARKRAAGAEEDRELWADGDSDHARKRVAEADAERERYLAIAAKYEAEATG